MNGLLEKLAARSLDSSPLSIRPRLPSRFEYGATVPSELGREEPIETAPTLARNEPVPIPSLPPVDSPAESLEQPRRQRDRSIDDFASSDIVSQERVLAQPRQFDTSTPTISPSTTGPSQTDALSQRLDQLDQRLRSLVPRNKPLSEVIKPAAPVTDEPREQITRNETHHHHQHTAIHRDSPTIVAEGRANKPDLTAVRSETLPPIERQFKIQGPIAPPQINSASTATSPPTETQPRKERPSAVPKIMVERTASAETNRTVNVTIGRIEVRAAQQPPAPTRETANRTSPRIMSLDDYMRRRVGGAG